MSAALNVIDPFVQRAFASRQDRLKGFADMLKAVNAESKSTVQHITSQCSSIDLKIATLGGRCDIIELTQAAMEKSQNSQRKKIDQVNKDLEVPKVFVEELKNRTIIIQAAIVASKNLYVYTWQNQKLCIRVNIPVNKGSGSSKVLGILASTAGTVGGIIMLPVSPGLGGALFGASLRSMLYGIRSKNYGVNQFSLNEYLDNVLMGGVSSYATAALANQIADPIIKYLGAQCASQAEQFLIKSLGQAGANFIGSMAEKVYNGEELDPGNLIMSAGASLTGALIGKLAKEGLGVLLGKNDDFARLLAAGGDGAINGGVKRILNNLIDGKNILDNVPESVGFEGLMAIAVEMSFMRHEKILAKDEQPKADERKKIEDAILKEGEALQAKKDNFRLPESVILRDLQKMKELGWIPANGISWEQASNIIKAGLKVPFSNNCKCRSYRWDFAKGTRDVSSRSLTSQFLNNDANKLKDINTAAIVNRNVLRRVAQLPPAPKPTPVLIPSVILPVVKEDDTTPVISDSVPVQATPPTAPRIIIEPAARPVQKQPSVIVAVQSLPAPIRIMSLNDLEILKELAKNIPAIQVNVVPPVLNVLPQEQPIEAPVQNNPVAVPEQAVPDLNNSGAVEQPVLNELAKVPVLREEIQGSSPVNENRNNLRSARTTLAEDVSFVPAGSLRVEHVPNPQYFMRGFHVNENRLAQSFSEEQQAAFYNCRTIVGLKAPNSDLAQKYLKAVRHLADLKEQVDKRNIGKAQRQSLTLKIRIQTFGLEQLRNELRRHGV